MNDGLKVSAMVLISLMVFICCITFTTGLITQAGKQTKNIPQRVILSASKN